MSDYPPEMVPTAVTQTVDLTTPGAHLRVVEVLTPAGIVRLNTNLIDVRTGRAVVVVEVEPNTLYGAKTAPGGEWETEVRDHGPGFRTDITLTRKDAR